MTPGSVIVASVGSGAHLPQSDVAGNPEALSPRKLGHLKV